MRKCMKKMSLVLCCCMVLGMLCAFSVKAASDDYEYDTTSKVGLAKITNNTPFDQTVSVNTRPTVGAGGAKVIFQRPNGKIEATQTFPFQTSIPDYSVTVPSGEIWYICIQPVVSGQRIAGVLTVTN